MVHEFSKSFRACRISFNWRILRRSVFFLSIICFVSCSLTQRPDQTLLLFERRTAETSQIYTVHPDGTELTLLTEVPSNSWYWLSPFGKYLAYLEFDKQANTYNLKILDTASSEIIDEIPQVGQTWSEHIPWQENVVWSPQGDRLAFLRSSEYGKEPDIFLYDLSAKEIKTLTYSTAVERSLTWSLDGSQIAFASWDGCKQGNCLPEEMYWNIVVMDSSGSNQQVISDAASFAFLPQDLWVTSLCNLTWSPDANYIAFQNECSELTGPSYWKEVFVTSVATSEIQRLTAFTDNHELNSNSLPTLAFKYSLHWSSDSTLFIGYTKIGVSLDGKFHGGILAVRNNTLNSFVRETEGMLGSTAKWSFNDEYLAWHTQYVDANDFITPGQIVIGQVENNQVAIIEQSDTALTGSCNKLEIFWSPDSKFAAYNTNRPEINCNDEEIDQSVAAISLQDQTFTDVKESVEGNINLLGWIFEPR